MNRAREMKNWSEANYKKAAEMKAGGITEENEIEWRRLLDLASEQLKMAIAMKMKR